MISVIPIVCETSAAWLCKGKSSTADCAAHTTATTVINKLSANPRKPLIAISNRLSFLFIARPYSLSRVRSATKFGSHVLPPSAENACSTWCEFSLIWDHTKRTRISRPLNISWS